MNTKIITTSLSRGPCMGRGWCASTPARRVEHWETAPIILIAVHNAKRLGALGIVKTLKYGPKMLQTSTGAAVSDQMAIFFGASFFSVQRDFYIGVNLIEQIVMFC